MLTPFVYSKWMVLWKTLVEKAVDNVEKCGFSTGIPPFRRKSRRVEKTAYGGNIMKPSTGLHLVTLPVQGSSFQLKKFENVKTPGHFDCQKSCAVPAAKIFL